MANALSVSRLVSVQTIFSPVAAGRRGFGTLLILGDSAVIGPSERLRVYTTLEAVAQDFGVNAPEYYGASLYFGQWPRPTAADRSLAFVGRAGSADRRDPDGSAADAGQLDGDHRRRS